jgi:glutathione S-transferase
MSAFTSQTPTLLEAPPPAAAERLERAYAWLDRQLARNTWAAGADLLR